MGSDEDLYEVLQVSPNAEPEVIEAAYRRLAFKYHPDHHAGSPEAEARMASINQAYEVLKSSQARAEYDGRRAPNGQAAANRRARTHARPGPSATPAAARPPRQKPPPPPRPALPQPPLLEDFGLSRWSARFTRFLTELLPGGIGRLAVLLVTPLVLLYLAGGLESREPDTLTGLSWLGWVVGLAVGLVAGAAAYGLLSVALKLVLAGRVKQLRAYRAAREVWRQQLHSLLSEFWQSLTEEQFTDEMASLFARSGFRVAPIRFGSGADLLLERQGRSLIAQCRKRSYQLESEDLYGLQDQLRASGIERGLVVCNKPLGQLEREKAHRHFRRKPIRLIDEARLLYMQEQVVEGRADRAAQAIWR